MHSQTLTPTRSGGSTVEVPEALSTERRQLQIDQDLLRLQEENLRAYEARLRGLQDEIDAARGAHPASPPLPHDPNLQDGWHKLHRARELLEAEQAHLRDDRNQLRDRETAVKQREQLLSAREEELDRMVAALVEKNQAAEPPETAPVTGFNLARLVMRTARLS